MFKVNINIVLIVLVAILSTTALIIFRFDQEPHQPAFVEEREFQRGEIVSSGDSFPVMTFGDAKIYLDKQTEVKIIDGRNDQKLINVIQGRILVDGTINIQTRSVITNINGISSFVHYSWEDRIEIANLQGEARIETTRDEKIITEDEAFSLQTLPPQEITQIEFNPTTSSASEFYEQIIPTLEK